MFSFLFLAGLSMSNHAESTVARAFLKYDVDRDGRINRFEFQGLIEELAPSRAANASAAFDEVDEDDNKTISFDEFIAWWTP